MYSCCIPRTAYACLQRFTDTCCITLQDGTAPWMPAVTWRPCMEENASQDIIALKDRGNRWIVLRGRTVRLQGLMNPQTTVLLVNKKKSLKWCPRGFLFWFLYKRVYILHEQFAIIVSYWHFECNLIDFTGWALSYLCDFKTFSKVSVLMSLFLSYRLLLCAECWDRHPCGRWYW